MFFNVEIYIIFIWMKIFKKNEINKINYKSIYSFFKIYKDRNMWVLYLGILI